MQSNDLIKGLFHLNPKARFQCVLVIGMVEETLALKALRQRISEESEQHIQQAIRWSGARTEAAAKRGHSTLNAIFDHFQINRELASGISPEEAQVMRKMQQQLDSQLRQMEDQNNKRRGQMALGSALGAGLIGGVATGASMASHVLNQSSMQIGDNPLQANPALRVAPTQLSQADISQQVKRLMQDSDPKRQRNAALALADINNPAALPYLALTVYSQSDEDLKKAAETSGKRIFWNLNYLAMDEDGRLEQEIEIRRTDLQHKPQMTNQSNPNPMKTSTSEDIANILDRAQKNRKRRKN